jgi:2-polyprenyl-6-methoxyphenol hydroxylase-like FAD-dependent oxidoreductase
MAEDAREAATRDASSIPNVAVLSVAQTTCCVVGAGPAGAILALLLARKGIAVTLLEAHGNFDRDFRGDTLHPAILEILDEIGLADKLLALPHAKLRGASIPAAGGTQQIVSFDRLKTRFPYIVMMPQTRFLEFITDQAKQYPSFQLILAASVQELVEENSTVRGVRYRSRDGTHELRATLTVGADGRFSAMRRHSGLPPAIETSPPMDILWFRLPRQPSESEGLMANLRRERVLIQLNRGDEWQIGCVIPKGSYAAIRAAGIEALRQNVVELAPNLADRIDRLDDWKKVSLLSVASDRLPLWYRNGLLLIGDAAHVMSPVGGNGINYAVQDAVAAANILARPLATGTLTVEHLAAVQRRRARPVRITQAIVTLMQNVALSPARASAPEGAPPAIAGLVRRLPFLGDLAARWIAFGLWPVHVEP